MFLKVGDAPPTIMTDRLQVDGTRLEPRKQPYAMTLNSERVYWRENGIIICGTRYGPSRCTVLASFDFGRGPRHTRRFKILPKGHQDSCLDDTVHERMLLRHGKHELSIDGVHPVELSDITI